MINTHKRMFTKTVTKLSNTIVYVCKGIKFIIEIVHTVLIMIFDIIIDLALLLKNEKKE